jgi:EAL domain-containing protein (putative c-di-GMP-specific phosphodiesterase class I)
VQIALDDFGTGFSSLGYLSQLPIDILKLDRSFVSRLGEPSERALFSGIVGLAHSLDLMAVGEGVETQEQLEILRSVGCERGQGYLFAKPMSGHHLAALLEQRSVASEAFS